MEHRQQKGGAKNKVEPSLPTLSPSIDKGLQFLDVYFLNLHMCLYFKVHYRSQFGTFKIWTKNILYCFIEDYTHHGMSRGATSSLALNEPNKVILHL